MPADRDLRLAYAARATRATGPAVSLVERALLSDLFEQVGPSSPTLSGAWDTHHLLAHLALRERSPVTTLRAVIPRLGDPAVEALVAKDTFADLVARLRTGPPRLSVFGSKSTDRRLNTLEFFIHHEDVRRAQDGWGRRELPTWAEDQLWHRLRVIAKVMTRRSPVAVSLRRSDDGKDSVARKGADAAVIRGLPSEIALFVYGRRAVADVDLLGTAASVLELKKARFTL